MHLNFYRITVNNKLYKLQNDRVWEFIKTVTEEEIKKLKNEIDNIILDLRH